MAFWQHEIVLSENAASQTKFTLPICSVFDICVSNPR